MKDDESANHLSNLLSKFNCINQANRLTDAFAATEYLNNNKTTVLFIESELTDILQSVQKPPFIIAICGHSSAKKMKNYLFHGINDFLFLPITEKNVRAIIGKILNICNNYGNTSQELPVAAEPAATYNMQQLAKSVFTNKSMFFNGGRKTESIRILFNDVLYIKSNGKQLEIFYENGVQKFINTSLQKFYVKLPKDKFQKINRCVIVNIDKVTKIIKQNKIIIGTECFTITRSFIKQFKHLLLYK